jgi:hypothetical protein
LRVTIARGRSYASVLVIPRRKMTLGRALHGRAAMAGVGAPWAGHKGSPQRKGKGEMERERERERGRRCGAPWGGRGGMGRGARLASYSLPVAAARSLLVVRAAVREGEEEKEEREKKRKGRKRKEKKKKKI